MKKRENSELKYRIPLNVWIKWDHTEYRGSLFLVTQELSNVFPLVFALIICHWQWNVGLKQSDPT